MLPDKWINLVYPVTDFTHALVQMCALINGSYPDLFRCVNLPTPPTRCYKCALLPLIFQILPNISPDIIRCVAVRCIINLTNMSTSG